MQSNPWSTGNSTLRSTGNRTLRSAGVHAGIQGRRPPAGILFVLLTLLTAPHLAAAPVSVSILSLLTPGSVHVAMKTPGTLSVFPPGKEATQNREIRSGESLGIDVSHQSLLLRNRAGLAQSVRITCPGQCLSELHVAGMTRFYHGDLEFRADNNTINIILFTDQESLTASILESERVEGGSPESLRAFAVTVRSFLAAGRRHAGFDFCDTTHCQVFQGMVPDKAAGEAASSTSGLVLTYRSRPFRPYYSRSCGGRTAAYEEVWGAPSPDYPFFAVDCPCGRDPRNLWTTRLPFDQLALAAGLPHPRLQREGNSMILTAGDAVHRYSVENFRTLLGRTTGWKILPGNRFVLREEPGAWVFTGRGAGHGVGFCQEGAEILAHEGQNFGKILQTYFPETNVEIR